MGEAGKALLDLVLGREQHAVLGEEFGGAGIGDRLEAACFLRQGLRQSRGRGGSQLGRRRRYDDVEQFIATELAFEHHFARAPGEVGRQQGVDVGVDDKMRGGIEAAADRQQHGESDDGARMAQAEFYDGDDDTGQHGFASTPAARRTSGESGFRAGIDGCAWTGGFAGTGADLRFAPSVAIIFSTWRASGNSAGR